MVPLNCLRGILLMLTVGWCLVLSQGQDVITFYPVYDTFEALGNAHYWLGWSLSILVVNLLGFVPLVAYWRPLCSGIQMGWWFTVALLFGMRSPIPTGLPAYLSLGLLAALCGYVALRSGRH